MFKYCLYSYLVPENYRIVFFHYSLGISVEINHMTCDGSGVNVKMAVTQNTVDVVSSTSSAGMTLMVVYFQILTMQVCAVFEICNTFFCSFDVV